MIFTVGGDVGVLFSGSRAHFLKRNCTLLQMKNSDKMPEKIGKKAGIVLIVDDNVR